MSQLDSILVIAGPTASGKSDYAQKLALKLNSEIINADSQQFYLGLDIGTGKVPLVDRQVPHHLLDILQPGERMDAMDFVHRADECVKDIIKRKKVPIVVGGTGFYLRAFLEGLDELPSRDDLLRAQLEERIQTEGIQPLHQELNRIDPVSAKKISPQDQSRLIRYLEIYELSGQKPSELMKKKRPAKLRYMTETHWLKPPREYLRERIATRVGQMLSSGWLEEVSGLLKAGLAPKTWLIKPLGYRELQAHLEGELSLEEAKSLIIKKTRAYAKRQETFFRGLFENPAYQAGGSQLKIFEEKSFFDRLLT